VVASSARPATSGLVAQTCAVPGRWPVSDRAPHGRAVWIPDVGCMNMGGRRFVRANRRYAGDCGLPTCGPRRRSPVRRGRGLARVRRRSHWRDASRPVCTASALYYGLVQRQLQHRTPHSRRSSRPSRVARRRPTASASYISAPFRRGLEPPSVRAGRRAAMTSRICRLERLRRTRCRRSSTAAVSSCR
jgi:hypothetical protein